MSGVLLTTRLLRGDDAALPDCQAFFHDYESVLTGWLRKYVSQNLVAGHVNAFDFATLVVLP